MNFTTRLLFAAIVAASSTVLVAEEPKVDTSPLPLETARAFPNLKFNRPLGLTFSNDGTNRNFVIGQHGTISVFPNDQEVEEAKIFIDFRKSVVYSDNEN